MLRMTVVDDYDLVGTITPILHECRTEPFKHTGSSVTLLHVLPAFKGFYQSYKKGR